MRHRLSALSSLFEYLCERNAVTHNPVKGVRRPKVDTTEGKTPAIADHQARDLLVAPGKTTVAGEETIKEKRDRAILSTLLYHAQRREELCKLAVKDFKHERRGVTHLKVSGKGQKTRYLPLNPATIPLVHEYLEAAGHGDDLDGALFRPVRNNRTGQLDQALTADGVYKLVRRYSSSASLSAPMSYARPRRRMRSTTRRILPRCRSGWATRTSPPRESTIIADRAPKTVRRSR